MSLVVVITYFQKTDVVFILYHKYSKCYPIPPVRKRANFIQRGKITGLREAEISFRDTGNRIGRNSSTLY